MTRIAVDTSVAIPLLHATHADHERVQRWAAERVLTLSGHAAVETYAVLTRLPGDARLHPQDALALIAGNFAEPLTLPPAVQVAVPQILAAAGIAAGATYDGLVALAARAAGLSLATRDARARPTYVALGLDVETVG